MDASPALYDASGVVTLNARAVSPFSLKIVALYAAKYVYGMDERQPKADRENGARRLRRSNLLEAAAL